MLIRIRAILKLLWSGLRFCCCGLDYYFDCCLDYCSAATVLAAVLFATVCGLGWPCCGFGCAVIFLLWARLWFYRFTVVTLSRCCSFGCDIIVVVGYGFTTVVTSCCVCRGREPELYEGSAVLFLVSSTAWSRLRSYRCGLGYGFDVVVDCGYATVVSVLLWM